MRIEPPISEKRGIFVSLGGAERARALLPLDAAVMGLDSVLPGPEAEAAILVGGYDLVIVDAVLFGGDVYELVRFVLQETACRVIVLGAETPMFSTGSDGPRVFNLDEPVSLARVTGLVVEVLETIARERAPEKLHERAELHEAAAEPAKPLGQTLISSAFQTAFSGATRYSVGDMVFDPRRRRLVRTDGSRIALSEVEFQLLCVFVAFAEEVLTAARISAELAATTGPVAEKSVAVQISRLRSKLGEKPGSPDIIQTVRRQGYVMVAPVRAIPDE
jgi:DNA-binding response OmpR family regulator